jgi:hypothetical protein
MNGLIIFGYGSHLIVDSRIIGYLAYDVTWL